LYRFLQMKLRGTGDYYSIISWTVQLIACLWFEHDRGWRWTGVYVYVENIVVGVILDLSTCHVAMCGAVAEIPCCDSWLRRADFLHHVFFRFKMNGLWIFWLNQNFLSFRNCKDINYPWRQMCCVLTVGCMVLDVRFCSCGSKNQTSAIVGWWIRLSSSIFLIFEINTKGLHSLVFLACIKFFKKYIRYTFQ
jgi:hypothetical protein